MLSRCLDKIRDERVPFTAGRYLIARSGAITKTSGGSLVPIRYTDKGEPIVSIDFGFGEVEMKLAVMLAICFKAIKLPITTWKQLDVLYIDGNVSNFDPTNTVWKFPQWGIKSNISSDFRYIPGFSRYQVNSEGVVYSNCTNKNLSPYTDGVGYYTAKFLVQR